MEFGDTNMTGMVGGEPPGEPPFRAWLEEVNSELGTAFAFTDEGLSSVVFEDGEQVWLQITGVNTLCIFSPLGPLPEPCTPEFLLAVLSLNAGHDPTMTGSVGFAPVLGGLVFSEIVLAPSSSALDLAIRLELFPQKLRSVRQLLKEFEEESQADDSAGGPNRTGGLLPDQMA